MSFPPPGRPTLEFLSVHLHSRSIPESRITREKKRFAASLIAEEHKSFGDQCVHKDDIKFEEKARDPELRTKYSRDILRGMLIRGRYQASVLAIYINMCSVKICSVKALEYPVDYSCKRLLPETCHSRIMSMLAQCHISNVNWDEKQRAMGMDYESCWDDYEAPSLWLSAMIARSFTSFEAVTGYFDRVRNTGYLDRDRRRKNRHDAEFKADPSCNRGPPAPLGVGYSGTFAYWLPECVDPKILEKGFDSAVEELSKSFYGHMERTEAHYRTFFDIDEKEFRKDFEMGTHFADHDRGTCFCLNHRWG